MKEKCMNAANLLLSQTFVLFGNDINIKSDMVFSFIILFAKHYIYSCRLQKCHPQLNVFLAKLKYRYKVEEYIARVQLKYLEFSAGWLVYKPLFEPM